MEKTAYLILQNGQVYTGTRFGAEGEISAELVFTTGMCGYLETITDPSYHGQMVLQTFPLMGNYGVIPEDFESPAPRLSAYLVRESCEMPSNFRCGGSLDDYLRESGVIGLKLKETRALTQILREYGVMNAAIMDELPADPEAFARGLALQQLGSDVYQVTCMKPQVYHTEGHPHIVLWDFGYKKGMITELVQRGCRVTVMPATSTCRQIMEIRPDGILLSNGPGDPSVNTEIIAELKKLLAEKIPAFGICLGHQLMALSQGAETVKLHYGHRGCNQPVRDLSNGRLYITSQNHGYAVDIKTLPEHAWLRFENLNDHTCEGLDYVDMPAFSVQFHPEARSGPMDTAFLFDRFLEAVRENQ